MVNMLHVQSITLALITAAMGKHTIGSEVVSEVVHEGREDAEMSIDEHNAYLAKVAEWCNANHLPPLTALISRGNNVAPGFWNAYPHLKMAEDKKAVTQALGEHFQKQCFDFFDGVGVANSELMESIERRITAIQSFVIHSGDQLPLRALLRYGAAVGASGLEHTSNAVLNIAPLQRPAFDDWLSSNIYFDEQGNVTGYNTATIRSEEEENTVSRTGLIPTGQKVDLIALLLADRARNCDVSFRQLEVKGIQLNTGAALAGTFKTKYIGALNQRWNYTVYEEANSMEHILEITFDPARGTFQAVTPHSEFTGVIVEVVAVATPFDAVQRAQAALS